MATAQTTLAVGTAKGLFLFRRKGRDWALEGEKLAGWEATTVLLGPESARLRAATVHYAYGATVRESRDDGRSWTQLPGRPAYAEGSPFKLHRIWQMARDPHRPGTVYAGVDEAGLFVSRDDAASWHEVKSLSEFPTRKDWSPGAGGLCLHTILFDPTDKHRMWIAISAVGAFRSDDAGKSWQQKTKGLPTVAGAPVDPCPCYCVHRMVLHPTKPNTLFMQFHGGVFVSRDAGDSWQTIESGLPGNFGFGMTITPKGTLLIAPLKDQEQRVFADGKLAIYRSTDEGASWHAITAGLPDEPTYSGVLRDSMTVDSSGVAYFGTTCGQVFASEDDGQTWQRLPGTLPRVLSVRAVNA